MSFLTCCNHIVTRAPFVGVSPGGGGGGGGKDILHPQPSRVKINLFINLLKNFYKKLKNIYKIF